MHSGTWINCARYYSKTSSLQSSLPIYLGLGAQKPVPLWLYVLKDAFLQVTKNPLKKSTLKFLFLSVLFPMQQKHHVSLAMSFSDGSMGQCLLSKAFFPVSVDSKCQVSLSCSCFVFWLSLSILTWFRDPVMYLGHTLELVPSIIDHFTSLYLLQNCDRLLISLLQWDL